MPPQKPPASLPTADTAEITAIKISASITAYSTAVVASLLVKNRRQNAMFQPVMYRKIPAFVDASAGGPQ